MMDNQKNEVKLNRTMTPGQMEMIAIGGTIGSGLFMGATSTIKWTGPSVLLAYAFVGLDALGRAVRRPSTRVPAAGRVRWPAGSFRGRRERRWPHACDCR